MRNREYVYGKLESLDSILTKIKYLINTSNSVQDIFNNIEYGKELIDEIKSQIENEPMSPNELNKF